MIASLPPRQQPDWLSSISQQNIKETFCLEDILSNSLYYPGSSLDPRAIHLFAGNVHSFVYSDCSVEDSKLTRWVNGVPIDCVTPISGYDLVASANIQDSDLSTDFCWDSDNRKLGRYSELAVEFIQRFRHIAGTPIFSEKIFSTDGSGEELRKMTSHILATDMEPWFFLMEKARQDFSPAVDFVSRRWNYLRYKAELLSRQFETPFDVLPPYARFFVFAKTIGAPEDAPDRISVLFLCEEASMVYRHLYVNRGIAPSVLMIHNVKNFHGDNRPWSAPDPVHSPLHEEVMTAPILPQYMAWNLYQDSCDWEGWEEFSSIPSPTQYIGDKPIQLLRYRERF
jgi:hypothetical protein